MVSQVGGAKGIVVKWIPPVSVSQADCCDSVTGGDPTGYLYLEPIDESVFINDSTKAISGLDTNGQYVGPQYNWFQEDDNFVPTLRCCR